MSQVLIHRYLDELSDLQQLSGTHRETVVREAFKGLLKGYGRARDLKFIPEYPLPTERGFVDGALVDPIRIPFGYWEAKDLDDDLERQIEIKFRKGYPQDNIIFEDSNKAILIQNTKEVMRCEVDQVDRLENLLEKFFEFENPKIARFRRAVEQFTSDLPDVLLTLRGMIDAQFERNKIFTKSANRFLKQAKATIHPNVSLDDIREMLIQHVLTEDIFSRVFGQDDFHRKNNIAKLLYELEATFFTGDVRYQTLKKLNPYYATIHSTAAEVRGHHEKQTFLKEIYQSFYRVYNVKLADRLGVVYTPNEIVRFIVQSADYLCAAHFGKRLVDRNVEILEPAAGTGTFVTELIDFFRRTPAKLREKYLEELHANEVAILPYYVANLNIEATFSTIMNEYVEYPNLCFVDTLDSVEGLGRFSGHQPDLFGALSEENYSRIKKQNKKKISVVIGNPPYNANQIRENDDNQNRKYPRIDARIKATYIKQSDATKTKQYDMYVRFFRWASDRIHDTGIVAFITNRSFLDAGNFDGFRKVVEGEFDYIYIVDLGGDWKKSGVAGGGNVFGIGTGVAIGFWIRTQSLDVKRSAKINYVAAPQMSGEDKLSWLESLNDDGLTFENILFEEITPKDGFWIDHPEASLEGLPIASKETKSKRRGTLNRSVFEDYSLGISTNRDEWLYDFDKDRLEDKVRLLISKYDEVKSGTDSFPDTIKWSETLKRRKRLADKEQFSSKRERHASYRPFVKKWLYQSPLFIDRPGLAGTFFPPDKENIAICFSDTNSRAPYCVLATNCPTDLHFGATSDGYQQVARYCYVGGRRLDNVTDWALRQFKEYYKTSGSKGRITKDAIFAYVYGILHDPVYREKYALNLKRLFPRIPFYEEFSMWSDWGRELLDLHVNYEGVRPWPLKRIDVADEKSRNAGIPPRAILRMAKETKSILLNGETELADIPSEAWNYKLGRRSAIEWILDQYTESADSSKLLRDNIQPYRFATYKEEAIDLLSKVVRVSVQTQRIIDQMRQAKR